MTQVESLSYEFRDSYDNPRIYGWLIEEEALSRRLDDQWEPFMGPTSPRLIRQQRIGSPPAPVDLGPSQRTEEPSAAAADATDASGFAVAACDPAATTTTEQVEVKAEPNQLEPKSTSAPPAAAAIILTEEQRDRTEANRLAALARRASRS
jgi:hypothetical protein